MKYIFYTMFIGIIWKGISRLKCFSVDHNVICGLIVSLKSHVYTMWHKTVGHPSTRKGVNTTFSTCLFLWCSN